MQQKPLIVQSDNTLLLEVDNPDFENARDAISPFAELEKSPEHMHTYRITPLSLWNAASSGLILFSKQSGSAEKKATGGYAKPELLAQAVASLCTSSVYALWHFS